MAKRTENHVTQSEQDNQPQTTSFDPEVEARAREQQAQRDALQAVDPDALKQAAQATPDERNAALALAQAEAAKQQIERETSQKQPVYKLNDGRLVDANGKEVKE